jgi:hypothetical protein
MKLVFLAKGVDAQSAVKAAVASISATVTVESTPYGQSLFVVSVLLEKETVNSAEILSGFRDKLLDELERSGKKGPSDVKALRDDASDLFCRRLYPRFSRFERSLHTAMMISLCTEVTNFNAEVASSLEDLTLGQVGFQLFKDPFKGNVDRLVKSGFDSKSDLIDKIKALDEGKLWDKLFAEGDLPYIKKRFQEIVNRRNDVMHFHRMNYGTYSRTLKVMRKANLELDDFIRTSIADRNYTTTRATDARAATRQLANSYATMVDAISNSTGPWRDYMDKNAARMREVTSALARYSDISKTAQQVTQNALANVDFSVITDIAPSLTVNQDALISDTQHFLDSITPYFQALGQIDEHANRLPDEEDEAGDSNDDKQTGSTCDTRSVEHDDQKTEDGGTAEDKDSGNDAGEDWSSEESLPEQRNMP